VRRRLHELDVGDAGLAHALDFGKPCGRRRDHFGERAEGRDQRLGERLDIAPRLRAKQQDFRQLVIRQRIGPSRAKTLAQALPMPVIVRQGFGEAWMCVGLLFQHGIRGQCDAV
jgi:hypothetical protein